MPVIITITKPSFSMEAQWDYSGIDRVLENKDPAKKEYEVFYSGQNQGRLDQQLLDCIANEETFAIYYRHKRYGPYTYLGTTDIVDVVQYRQAPIGVNAAANQKLQLHFVVRNVQNTIVPKNNFNGTGRFKKDILVHSSLRNTDGTISIPHNKNTNIGFYCYTSP